MALFSSTSSATAGLGDNSAAANSQAKLEEDLNQFLNLLVTQLQNQDPLEPLDSNEFTSQLVDFANVEQQISQNAHLENMLNLLESGQTADMVSYLGTSVQVEGRRFNVDDLGTAKLTYSIPQGTASATLTITNSSGLTVFTTNADTSTGTHTFEWNGRDSNGNPVPQGEYNVLVSALDAQNNLQDVTHTVYGNVSGVSSQGGELKLFMGNIEIPFENIISVQEPEERQSTTGDAA